MKQGITKKEYALPLVSIVDFEAEDVIRTSDQGTGLQWSSWDYSPGDFT